MNNPRTDITPSFLSSSRRRPEANLGNIGASRAFSGSASMGQKLWLLYPALLLGMPKTWQGGLPIAPASIWLIAVMYVGGMLDIGLRKGVYTRSLLNRIPLVVWVLWTAMGMALIANPSRVSLEHPVRLLLWIATFSYGIHFFGDTRSRGRFFALWVLLALAGASIFLLSPSRWWQPEVNIMAFQHRTGFAYFLAVPTAILINDVFFRSSDPRRLLKVLSLLLLVPALLMALSRGAWVVVLAGFSALLFFKRRFVLGGALLIVGAVLIIGFAYGSESDLALRLRSIWDFNVRSSSLYRLDLFLASLRASPEVGLIGQGPGSALPIVGQYTIQNYHHLQESALASKSYEIDSDFVWLLVESGPIAILALGLTLWTWGAKLFRRFKTAAHEEKHDAVRCLMLFVLFVTMLMFDNVLTTPYGWFLLGVGIGSAGTLPLRMNSDMAVVTRPVPR